MNRATQRIIQLQGLLTRRDADVARLERENLFLSDWLAAYQEENKRILEDMEQRTKYHD